ncbi:MAG TPA: hypothetical protein PLW86_02975, partial [Rhodocyclaceae bacterium]|nr:hypothetical protein [Rhodocyclaceae bacterium]
YLTRLQSVSGGTTPAPTLGNAYRHLLAFARSALDKFGAWLGRLDHAAVDFPDRAAFDALLASGRGAILLGAHFGNLEMMRGLASHEKLPRINAVVYTEHAQRFVEMLSS